MRSFSSPSPLTIPSKHGRTSSSSSMDSYVSHPGDAVTPSSPLLSSSPLRTPSHPAANEYLDDMDVDRYHQRDGVEGFIYPWSRHAWPKHSSDIHQPLPSLMTKFAAHAFQSVAPLSYSPPPLSAHQIAHLYSQGDSAVAEEYDLESMDIHIRETYFATSAERGRWLSSPIAPRVRPQAVPPMRGHSSPIKAPAGGRTRKRKRGCSADIWLSISPLIGHHEDARCLSSLPPSSPPTSPMSDLSFLGDDCEGNSVDPRSNSDGCYSLAGTPELSISSTMCTSPFDLAPMPTPHEAPTIVPALRPTDLSRHLLPSDLPCCTNPSSNHGPKSVDLHVHASGVTGFEFDAIPPPPSQPESNLASAEPLKLPLSDAINKHYPGNHTTTPDATIHVAQSQDGPSCIQSPSTNVSHEPPEVSLNAGGGSSSDKRAKRRESTSNLEDRRRTKKRTIIRSVSPPPDRKKWRGVNGQPSNRSEPLDKESSHCRGDSESHGAKSLSRRRGKSKIERHSRPTVESHDPKSARQRDGKSTTHAQLRQPIPGSSTKQHPMDGIDTEFHASLTGMLIEALATSRATSMDSAALYLVLIQAHPYLVGERSRDALLTDIAVVLEAGRARCGMFEKVDSSGEKSRHKALDSRWFYVPERDEDPERASLIDAIMPRQKRNETKKYKQYYYQPLDRISRWDPEDAP